MLTGSRIIDISMDLNGKTLVWPDDPQPELRPVARMPEAACNFTWLDFSAHAGTHVDAPYFLFPDKWTVDRIPLSRLMGDCQVLDLASVADTIEPSDLERCEIASKIVLMKTRNSRDPLERYNPRHVALGIEAAKWLVKRGVTTIGYDYQSFERDGANDVHRVLLEKQITVIDNLRLAKARPGRFTLICLPIKVTGIDGAPARAVLIDRSRQRAVGKRRAAR